MNNIGYKLGKLVLNYKKWQHPLSLKITYGFMMCLLIFSLMGMLLTIIIGVLSVIFLTVIRDNNHLTSNDYDNGYRNGPEGVGFYVMGTRTDKYHDDL